MHNNKHENISTIGACEIMVAMMERQAKRLFITCVISNILSCFAAIIITTRGFRK